MQFIYQFEKSSPKIMVEISSQATLNDVLDAFEDFLLASGYSLNPGSLVIEPDDEMRMV